MIFRLKVHLNVIQLGVIDPNGVFNISFKSSYGSSTTEWRDKKKWNKKWENKVIYFDELGQASLVMHFAS